MGDSGVNQQIKQEGWQFIADNLVQGIKQKKVVTGLENAIESCRKLVLDKNFVIEENDKNELNDALIIKV